MDNTNIPVSEDTEENISLENLTADDINEQIMAKNDDGYSPCTIVAMIEHLHNVTPDDDFDFISDEDREIIDSRTIEYCNAEVYSFNGELLNLILNFDTPQDAYLKDLDEMLNDYKKQAKNYINQETSIIPMFSISFLPEKYNGRAGATFSFPVAFFKTLGSDNKETSMQFLFEMENAAYEQYDIDEDMLAEIEADILREIDQKEKINEAAENSSRRMFD